MVKPIHDKLSQSLWLLISFIALCCLIACGGSKDTTPSSTGSNTTTTTIDAISLAASSPTVKSDNSNSTTITVYALANNAAVGGVAVSLSADTILLGAANVTTSTNTPATVTFSSGGNPINRTATITATAGTVSTQIPIQIVGSTVTLGSSTTAISIGSNALLTVTAKNAGGSIVPGANVALTQTPAGRVTFMTAASGTTDNTGTFTATIQGATSGTATITATALGATATTDLTVSTVTDAFAIDRQMINSVIIDNNSTTAMKINTDTLNIRVHAPAGVANVTFATTIGQWNGGGKVVTLTPSGNEVGANLTTTQVGVASVQIYNTDVPATMATLTVAMSSGAAADHITLQAAPTNVPASVGTTTGSSTLTATVYDSSNNPIGGVPVAFSIVTPSSGGETVLPVIATTASTTTSSLGLGQAIASFTSGSLASGSAGIKIRASVAGTTVQTGTSPSGSDAIIIIGGVAGSIAFGRATVITTLNDATYSYPMSVLVADSAGAAVSGAVVSLSVFPIAWSTGVTTACAYDGDNGKNMGTFWTEDINENLYLDPGEDGKRTYYLKGTYYGTDATDAGTADGYITPTNSAAGTVPSTVTTDSNGAATFNLNYPKQSAIWTIVRLRGTTMVSGTETRAELIFRLPAMDADVSPCLLGYSPYTF